MPEKEGKWKPHNVKALEDNITQVFRSGDIRKLNNPTYEFIIQHMGFIAHYELHGFQDVYQDLDDFRLRLQTSEYSEDDLDYNLRWADREDMDCQFNTWYGEAYCHSVAEGIRRIVAVAKRVTNQPMLPIPK